jgi:hypothetical protein
MNRLSILFLILFALSGCGVIPQQGIPVELKKISKDALDYGDFYLGEYSKRYAASGRQSDNTLPMQTGYELISEEVNKFHSITERLYPKVSKSQVEVIQKCDSSLTGYYAEYLFLSSTLLQYNTPIANEPESNVEERLNKFNNSRESVIKDCKL